MALTELRVECVDAATKESPSDGTAFVRCSRHVDTATMKSFLRLELVCGARLWRTNVFEKQKPAVLDCSATEFLQALETAFTLDGNSRKARFSFKWSSEKALLTLTETDATSGFAMKYASLSFTVVESAEQGWQQLLHDVVVQSERSLLDSTRQRERIQELENMLTKKDALLETALTAKQRLEDELFTKFCAVLNGKKEEIERLQREVAMANASSSSKAAYKPQAAPKKRAAPAGKKKTLGAKLTKTTTKKPAKKLSSEDDSKEDEDAMHNDEEDSESGDESQSEHSTAEDQEDDESPTKTRSRSRVKRQAIDAYSQLASQIPMSSQVCAAADVLDDLDAIMKTEVEQDDEQATSTRSTRKRPPPSTVQRSRSPEKKIKPSDPTPAKSETPTPKAKPASPPRKPVDSEEEDILDMLS